MPKTPMIPPSTSLAPRTVAILCPGLDSVRRGFETHARNVFSALTLEQEHSGWKPILIKRDGKKTSDEYPLHTPGRSGRLCLFLARFRGDRLYWESVFFMLGFIAHTWIRRKKYDIIYNQDASTRMLKRLRFLIYGNPKFIFKHGVSMTPEQYYKSADVFQEINIEHFHAMGAFLSEKNAQVPYFLLPNFILGNPPERYMPDVLHALREKLGMVGKKIVLSVGIINTQKRMDYLIREVAQLPEEWALIICGKGDENIIAEGQRMLGDARFRVLYLNRTELNQMYQLADVFVLASQVEGFGNVLLEAMNNGTPVITQERPLFRWIAGDAGAYLALGESGSLARFIKSPSFDTWQAQARTHTGEQVQKFSWENLKSEYFQLLEQAYKM